MSDTPAPPVEHDLPDLPDLTHETDDYLTALAAHVEAEQEARRTRANIPGLVSSLAQQYVQGGGDRAQLVNAVTTPPEPEDEPVPSQA